MERCGTISNANFSAKSVGRMRVEDESLADGLARERRPAATRKDGNTLAHGDADRLLDIDRVSSSKGFTAPLPKKRARSVSR